jgi:hypothetical protein
MLNIGFLAGPVHEQPQRRGLVTKAGRIDLDPHALDHL